MKMKKAPKNKVVSLSAPLTQTPKPNLDDIGISPFVDAIQSTNELSGMLKALQQRFDAERLAEQKRWEKVVRPSAQSEELQRKFLALLNDLEESTKAVPQAVACRFLYRALKGLRGHELVRRAPLVVGLIDLMREILADGYFAKSEDELLRPLTESMAVQRQRKAGSGPKRHFYFEEFLLDESATRSNQSAERRWRAILKKVPRDGKILSDGSTVFADGEKLRVVLSNDRPHGRPMGLSGYKAFLKEKKNHLQIRICSATNPDL